MQDQTSQTKGTFIQYVYFFLLRVMDKKSLQAVVYDSYKTLLERKKLKCNNEKFSPVCAKDQEEVTR